LVTSLICVFTGLYAAVIYADLLVNVTDLSFLAKTTTRALEHAIPIVWVAIFTWWTRNSLTEILLGDTETFVAILIAQTIAGSSTLDTLLLDQVTIWDRKRTIDVRCTADTRHIGRRGLRSG
tara:strand:- start:3557 stop:3922 length:366 start_codon:yes stop_codon:yes gene_type:complete